MSSADSQAELKIGNVYFSKIKKKNKKKNIRAYGPEEAKTKFWKKSAH